MWFEDENVISYEMKVIGSTENDMIWSINPNIGDFDRWLVILSSEANKYLSSEDYRRLFLQGSEGNFGKYPFCLLVNIKLKGEKDEKHWGAACNLSEQGVDMLEDLIVAYKRLSQIYDKVIIGLNGSHSDYKPSTIKVYFNPIVD